MRCFLKGIYATLKAQDENIKFTFVTGISKFSQVSLFSGPNYLTDITMRDEYGHLLGYTEEEVMNAFQPHVASIADKRNLSDEVINEEIRIWYNGYRFSKEAIPVYNPFSTLNYMQTGAAEGHWYRTGTPSFLVKLIKDHPVPLSGATALKSALMDIGSLANIDLTALMFQTGYLTIKDCTSTGLCYLEFPNKEGVRLL